MLPPTPHQPRQQDLRILPSQKLEICSLQALPRRTLIISRVTRTGLAVSEASPKGVGVMKVTIKQWNAVASWRWDMPEDDVCGICRVQFDGTCPTCKYPGDDCALREI